MGKQEYPEPTVGGLIFNPEGKILLVRSHKWLGKYVIPGGHIELGETMEAALRREVKEETGLEIYAARLICIQEFIYDDAFWEKRHFLFFDYACKTDSTEVVLNSESEQYTWVYPDESFQLELDPYTERMIRTYLEPGGGRTRVFSGGI